MKHVLLIGGTDFIGFAIARRLQDENFELTLLNRGRRYWNDVDVDVESSKRTLLRCDRRDADRMLSMLRDAGKTFDVVIDTCAYKPSDIVPLFDFLVEQNAHYIFISTDSVYESSDLRKRAFSDRCVEDDAVRPEDPAERELLRRADVYGDDKLQCEEALAASRVHYTSLRLPDVIGARDNTFRHWQYQLAVKLGSMAFEERELTRSLSFVWSEDVAHFIVCVIANGAATFGRAFNVAFDERPTVVDYVAEVARALALPPATHRIVAHSERRWFPSVSERVSPLDCSAATALGWRATPLRVALSSTVAWHERAWHAFAQLRPRAAFRDDEWHALEANSEATRAK